MGVLHLAKSVKTPILSGPKIWSRGKYQDAKSQKAKHAKDKTMQLAEDNTDADMKIWYDATLVLRRAIKKITFLIQLLLISYT